jgi:glycosyltransferase involved in cell wall biosynthesis
MHDLTAHMMLKNEEVFCTSAINSVLNSVDSIIIVDTGSSDSTVKKIKSIRSNKIKLIQKPAKSPADLTKIRNFMLKQTKTKWFLIIDGDEVYDGKKLALLIQGLNKIKRDVYRITLARADFINSSRLRSRTSRIGKIFRTNGSSFEGNYPYEQIKCKVASKSIDLGKKLLIYHYGYFKRSSKDNSAIRHWRNLPFPIIFGKEKAPITDSNRLIDVFNLIFLNLVSLLQKSFGFLKI